MLFEIVRLLRPQQWIKNMFVFLPLFFHGDLNCLSQLFKVMVAFVCFSLMASSIYCFNDIYDVDADRQHPKKCKRPIASGKIGLPMAYLVMASVFILSLAMSLFVTSDVRIKVQGLLIFYFLMNIAYCVKLKHIALVDVFIIAIGFVLRVVLGGVVCHIELTHWIVLMTFLLALFLAFAKRRDDVVIYEDTGVIPRRNVNRYNLVFMNLAITIVATITLVSYIMYSVSEEVIHRLGSRNLYMTTIFVLLGILRYIQLTVVDVKSGSPTRVLLKDRFVQCCVIGWLASFLVLIYI